VLKTNHYILTLHWCRFCGIGRILQRTNSGPSGGGNPTYCCTHCEQRCSGMGPEAICYCGWDEGHNTVEYACWDSKMGTIPDGYRVWKKQYNMEILKRYTQ